MRNNHSTLKPCIHVALAADEAYLKYLAVTLCSILKHLSSEAELCVYVIGSGLSEDSKQKIKKLERIRKFDLNYVDVGLEEYSEFKIYGAPHISSATYVRFKLPDLLSHLDKCLYLDCDILVRTDISQLWNIDIGTDLFGAVEEPSENFAARNQRVNIPSDKAYFNSGVLLMNLARLREIGFESKAFKFLADNGGQKYGDQDVLNALFYNDWFALPLKWNVITLSYALKELGDYRYYREDEVKSSLSDPAIAHFTQAKKPDSFLCEHPFRSEYREYLELTEWRGLPFKDLTAGNVLRMFFGNIKERMKFLRGIFRFFRGIKRRLTGYES